MHTHFFISKAPLLFYLPFSAFFYIFRPVSLLVCIFCPFCFLLICTKSESSCDFSLLFPYLRSTYIYCVFPLYLMLPYSLRLYTVVIDHAILIFFTSVVFKIWFICSYSENHPYIIVLTPACMYIPNWPPSPSDPLSFIWLVSEQSVCRCNYVQRGVFRVAG